MQAVVFASVFPQYEDLLHKDGLVLMRGKLNSEPDDPIKKIVCEDVVPLERVPGKLTQSLMLKIDKTQISEGKITYLKNILSSHKGKVPVYFRVSLNGKNEIHMISKKVKVAMSFSLVQQLIKILSIENIKIMVKSL